MDLTEYKKTCANDKYAVMIQRRKKSSTWGSIDVEHGLALRRSHCRNP